MRNIFYLNRRQFLRSAGGLMALPFLNSLPLPLAAAKSVAEARKRLVTIGTFLSMYPGEWHPKKDSNHIPRLLEPLMAHRKDFTVVSGVDHGINGGHKGTPSFLSGVYQPEYIGESVMVRNQITLDQLAAKHLSRYSRFHSLQLGASEGKPTQTLSWDENGVPLLPEPDPIKVFQKLFVEDLNPQAASRAMDFKRSVLDMVAEDARSLQKEIGYEDREKVDAYFSSIRDVEKRIERQQQWVNTPKPGVPPLMERPTTFHENLDLMLELTALALQHDSTRVVSVELPAGGLPIILDGQQLSGYHGQSHHGKDPEVLEELIKIEQMHTRSVATFLTRLKGIQDGDATLFDRTQVLFGSGLGNGSSHSNKNLPVLLAGGDLRHGKDLIFEEGTTPLCNVFVTMLQQLGIETDAFAVSTGNINNELA
ncbi:MAG: DUF1552 domain-containing protein [Verrucomicrobia bacterium]|nr:DUF1552 domain-containing protein [Verrucomicrobiota bacterium]